MTPALADVGTVRGCKCHCGVVSDLNQDVVQVQLDAGCQGMSRLIHDQLFLTSMVHALEEQKNFSIKKKSVWRRFFRVVGFDRLSFIHLSAPSVVF